MSRDRTRTRDSPTSTSTDEFDADFEFGDDRRQPRTDSGTAAETGGLRARVAERTGELFSPRIFIAALLFTVVGLFVANTLVPLPGAGLVGIFGATFGFGLAVKQRRYAETAVAGGIAAAGSALLDFVVIAFLGGLGVPLVAVMGLLGAAIAMAGTYFGRDLREGLTREL